MTEDLIHHGQAAVSATLFQGWPSQVLDHSGGTAVIILVACDILGRVALDLFKLVGVPVSLCTSCCSESMPAQTSKDLLN